MKQMVYKSLSMIAGR